MSRAVVVTRERVTDEESGERSWFASTEELPEGESLSFLQERVEGYVEKVTVNWNGTEVDVWVNEEGLYREAFDWNPLASSLAQNPIAGPSVVTGFDASTGDTTPLPDGVAEEILEALRQNPVLGVTVE